MNDREKFEALMYEQLFKYNLSIHKTFKRDKDTGVYVRLPDHCAWLAYQAATAESAARIAEIEQKLVEISSLMTLWKKGLLTGDELGKSLFVVHESKPAITNIGDKT